jgi:hypothetical protein
VEAALAAAAAAKKGGGSSTKFIMNRGSEFGSKVVITIIWLDQKVGREQDGIKR